MSTAKRILHNTLYGAVGRFWLIGVSLFLTPLILSYLGDEKFALWALFWAFSAYFMLMDLGLSVALVRRIAGLHEAQDTQKINQAMVSVLLLIVIIGLLIWGIAFVVGQGLLILYPVSAHYDADVQAILLWACPALLLVAMMRVFDSFLRGVQRFDVITKVSMLTSVVNVLSAYAALAWGYGIPGLMLATVLTFAAQMLLMYRGCLRLYPALSLHYQHFSRQELAGLLPLGARIQVARLAELATYQTDKILLAFLMPLSYVTFYDLGAKIAAGVRDATYTFTNAIFPVAAQIQAKGENAKLWFLYERGTKYLLMFTTPALALMLLTAPMLLGVWLGHVSEDVLLAVCLLSLAYWLIVNMSMAFNVGTAQNWAKPIMHGAILQTVLNVSLSFILIYQWGFIGALLGTLLATLISKGYVMHCFYRDFQRAFTKDLSMFGHIVWVNAPAIVATYLLSLGLKAHFDYDLRLDALASLSIAVAVYILLYLLCIRWFGVLDNHDFQLLAGRIPKVAMLIKRKHHG